MTKFRHGLFALALAFPALGGGAAAQDQAGAASRTVAIGYVDLAADPRYLSDSAHSGIVFRTLGRPFPGAELGVQDAQATGQMLGRRFALKHSSGRSLDEIVQAVTNWARRDEIHFVLADLPGPELTRLADAVKDQPVLLLNVSARDDTLRGKDCRANVAHTIPSDGMLTDALVEFLVARNWPRILALQGATEQDAARIAALRRSAAKFGAQLLDVRSFSLGNDPRNREQNNVALVTGGIDADVVFVADSSGEFGRYVPYQTLKPMPVVGDAGLTPRAWHWTWDRNGAPQLQHRFEALAKPRRMNDEAWAAWIAVEAVVQADLRAKSPDFESMRATMLGERFNLDTAKGNRGSFRTWDHQLRQNILLATADAVIDRAPLPKFLHQSDVLDTLGTDQPETQCRF